MNRGTGKYWMFILSSWKTRNMLMKMKTVNQVQLMEKKNLIFLG